MHIYVSDSCCVHERVREACSMVRIPSDASTRTSGRESEVVVSAHVLALGYGVSTVLSHAVVSTMGEVQSVRKAK